jgi:hypothetical protein
MQDNIMQIQIQEPSEDDNLDCHLQQIGMGSLLCRGATQTGRENTTNEVSPAVCFSCDVGKIYREVGCDAPLPRITIYQRGPTFSSQPTVTIACILCKIRRRNTTLEYCRTCMLATAESTRQMVTTTHGLLQSMGFSAAYKDLEKARLAIRDGEFERSITHSIACLESACRFIHEELGSDLPKRKDLTGLWKSTRDILELDHLTEDDTLSPLLNSLHGVVTNVGATRNTLSDAHGKGKYPPLVSEAIAELALNSAATITTFAVRHYRRKSSEEE